MQKKGKKKRKKKKKKKKNYDLRWAKIQMCSDTSQKNALLLQL